LNRLEKWMTVSNRLEFAAIIGEENGYFSFTYPGI